MTTSPRTDAKHGLVPALIGEIVRDAYRYVPGIEPDRPTLNETAPTLGRRAARLGHRGRDLLERAAARFGVARRHHDPAQAGAALVRILALSDGLERTAALLGDEPSRRAILDVLKLRVLGPYHAPLSVTPDHFRAMQSYVDRTMLREPATFEVADPWFSPLSLYEISRPDGQVIHLHAHSVDVVSVFLLEQYSYRSGGVEVAAQAGDVVLDVGGCWGDTALYFAHLVGPAGKVYTFEFDPDNLAIMRANLALNPRLAERIEIVEKALWDVSGQTLQFAVGGRTTTLLPDGRTPSLTAETVALDEFARTAGLDRVGFVKMDVEGSELKVVAGGGQTLAHHAPKLALAAYHQDDDLVELPRAIEALDRGYRCFIHTSSPLEEETVLFATPAAALRNPT